MAAQFDLDALRAAAEIIAREARLISGRFSRRIPYSIHVQPATRGVEVAAGGPEAPHARMFETPGARHPLFGNKRHWYTQPYRPFLEQAEASKGQDAAEKYADIMIDRILRRWRE